MLDEAHGGHLPKGVAEDAPLGTERAPWGSGCIAWGWACIAGGAAVTGMPGRFVGS